MPVPVTEFLAQARTALAEFRYAKALATAQLVLGECELGSGSAADVAEAHGIAGRAALALGELSLAGEHLDHAADMLLELGDERQMAACQLGLAECSLRKSDLARAVHITKALLPQVRTAGWRDLEARSLLYLGAAAWMDNRLDEAQLLLDSCTAMCRQQGLDELLQRARCSQASLYALQQRGAEARALLVEALDYFRRIGDLAQVARCLNNLAGLHFSERDYAAAREYLLQCVAIETEMQDKADLASAWYNLGLIELRHGELRLARKYASRAYQLSQEIGDRDVQSVTLMLSALIALKDGAPAEALNYALLSSGFSTGATSAFSGSLAHYLPLILLANSQTDAAEAQWRACRLPEGGAELDELSAMLKWLVSADFRTRGGISVAAQSIAQRWLHEVSG